jgi:hypothetical protein
MGRPRNAEPRLCAGICATTWPDSEYRGATGKSCPYCKSCRRLKMAAAWRRRWNSSAALRKRKRAANREAYQADIEAGRRRNREQYQRHVTKRLVWARRRRRVRARQHWAEYGHAFVPIRATESCKTCAILLDSKHLTLVA